MLIPQFSLRWLLGLVAVCAVVFSIFGLAVRGHGWAGALSIAILGLVAAVLAYAVLFCLVWLYSLAMRAGGRKKAWGRSPFSPVVEQIRASAQQDDDEEPVEAIVLE